MGEVINDYSYYSYYLLIQLPSLVLVLCVVAGSCELIKNNKLAEMTMIWNRTQGWDLRPDSRYS